MELYNDTVPDQANILRDGKWLKMDSASVVPGDVVMVTAADRVPADIRIMEVRFVEMIGRFPFISLNLQASDDCMFNTEMVNGKTTLKSGIPSESGRSYEGSPNMAFTGYLCKQGDIASRNFRCT